MKHWVSAFLCILIAALRVSAADLPNFVIVFVDDMGYGDAGCYGSKIPTPNLDRMAEEGARFTNFYVAQAVCSASRAALLTGCYSKRVSVQGAYGPKSKEALNKSEITLADILKKRGYATGIFGKWHLGDHPDYLPTKRGFDEWFGLPYSNDMWPPNGAQYPPLPLYENDKVVQTQPDQSQLTTWYTERSVKFIEKHKDHPFFLYVPHSMPHVPLFVSDKFKGKSGQGLYGDVIMELDGSVGEILGALKKNGLDEKTLVIFSSDNGPWLIYGDHGGSSGGLREGKGTAFEGGVREPFIARWPGRVRPGLVSDEIAVTFDLFTTIAKLAGAEIPTDRIIDGKDIMNLMTLPNAKGPHDYFFYYYSNELRAVRDWKWKLHAPHGDLKLEEAGRDGKRGTTSIQQVGAELYDLEIDPSETKNVAAENPDVVKRLQAQLELAREDLGDAKTKREGKGVRPAGKVEW